MVDLVLEEVREDASHAVALLAVAARHAHDLVQAASVSAVHSAIRRGRMRAARARGGAVVEWFGDLEVAAGVLVRRLAGDAPLEDLDVVPVDVRMWLSVARIDGKKLVRFAANSSR
jgi:spore coat polysaccharide biosynthesis protein SpsF (cytidylyltransferase family)